MAQVKFVVDKELLRKFKQIVLAKRGKIELTPEGEEALRLYISKYAPMLKEGFGRGDALVNAIGAVRSSEPHNALHDLKELESAEA